MFGIASEREDFPVHIRYILFQLQTDSLKAKLYVLICGNKMPTRCNRGAEGYVSGLQDAAASCKPDT